MKTDSKSQWEWVKQADLHMANSAMHGLFHSAHGGLSPEHSVVLRLVEVPTNYWSKKLRDDPHVQMYSSIPLHRALGFEQYNAARPARLCYHGNQYHFLEEAGLIAALGRLAAGRGPPIQVSLIQDRSERLLRTLAGVPNLTVTQSQWTSMDDTFSQLASCDLGLVPNVEEAPSFSVNADVGNPQINLKYKGSTNAGRAYVMAQVGLPFVSSPEPEAAELLGAAGLRSHEFLAMGADTWAASIMGLLRDAGRRSRASQALRTFAERELTVEPEAAELERRIRAALSAARGQTGYNASAPAQA
uniref:Uncharacterized protein n=1 Tax=Alexandrium catenella TaxID=2925 RepID=A0A7S1LAH3_ALECA